MSFEVKLKEMVVVDINVIVIVEVSKEDNIMWVRVSDEIWFLS